MASSVPPSGTTGGEEACINVAVLLIVDLQEK